MLELEKTKGGEKDLYIDCKDGKFNIRKYEIEQNLTALIGNNFMLSSNNTYSKCSVKQSIQELKNRVIYTDNDEKSLKRVEAKKQDSILTYGLLTTIETVDTNKNNNLKQLAENKVNELNVVKEDITLSLLADHRVSKGKLIDFTNSDYGLSGVYLVKTATHELTATGEIVSVSIEKQEKL